VRGKYWRGFDGTVKGIRRMDSSGSRQTQVSGCCEYGTELPASVNGGQFPKYMRNCLVLTTCLLHAAGYVLVSCQVFSLRNFVIRNLLSKRLILWAGIAQSV
jgi:hypothetical protein